MKIAELYDLFLKFHVISTDTRNIKENSLFFALKGDSFNGNEFAHIALESGCTYAIIDQEKYQKSDKYILVPNVLATLQELARFHRNKLNIPVIGITGTNGKTTTKELLSAILGTKFNIFYTQGNLNNHIGVPLTILSIQENTEIAVVEMGANHLGEIEFLCSISQPTHGLITNIGKAHLEGFGSFEGVKNTKKELYDYLITNKGIIFANADNLILMDILHNQLFVAYGKSENAICSGIVDTESQLLAADITINNFNIAHNQRNSCTFSVSSNLVGDFNFENLLAAITIGSFFGVDSDKISEAVFNYQPDNNRSQLKKTEKNTLVLDAYNANPSSMRASILNFAGRADENNVVILGDMLELGAYSEAEHLNIIELLSDCSFKQIYLVGPVFCLMASKSKFLCFENTESLILRIKENPIENSKILIKGSRGIKLERVVPFL